MRSLHRAAGLVSAATFVSRVLGLLRDAIRAALLGADRLSDAVNVAFKVPNLLRDLFAEGAFSGAFVPTIARTRETEGVGAAHAVLNRVISTLLVYLGAVVLLMVSFAPQIVRVLTAPEFVADAEQFERTVLLVRLLAPFLLFISIAVAAMGALNVGGHYFLPALSPAAQNALLVAGGLLLYFLANRRGVEAAVPWALLLLGGGILQFLVQLPTLWREGWRPRFLPDVRLRTRETREILRRMLPVAAGLAATHVSILINTRLATAHEGGQSNLDYAFRLIHLPVGLVGVAVGTVVLAEASRRAARQEGKEVGRLLREALRLSFALSAPACAGLLALGVPIAHMLFRWGETSLERATEIGVTIRCFAPAVIFYCAVKVVVPVFYAQGRIRVPLAASLTAVVANVVAALSLHPTLQWRGLALAIGIGQAANLAVLLWMSRRVHGREGESARGGASRILLAAALCGLAAWGCAELLPAGESAVRRLLRGLLPVAVGGGAYVAAGSLLRSPEILGLMRRTLRSPSLDSKGAPP